MNKLLIIVGPTATGKTALALHLAKTFNGEIISADSRQVYKYMDIGTGKEKSDNIPIYGYDLVLPDQSFSVSQFAVFARKKILEIVTLKKLPILVGGTGLYIKAVVDNLSSIDIPRNLSLRKKLASKNATELFAMLTKASPEKAQSLNASDRANPRRLIRALEILANDGSSGQATKTTNFDSLWIGLTTSKDKLHRRIANRVDERVAAGFAKEIDFLKQKDLFKFAPSATLGYKDWPDIEKWRIEERKYAKRQLTWFKKEKRIHWFDISDPKFQQKVVSLVQIWDNKA